jgi:peroxiredoxin
MKLGYVAALAFSLTAIAVGLQGQQIAKAGDRAPDFSAAGSDGKTHTRASLTKEGPVFLYFIQDGCPVNDDALPHFKRLQEAYKGRARIVGVYDGDARAFARWNQTQKVPFLVLYDPQMTVIKAYKARRSPWAIQVNPDGRIGNVWAGYSRGELEKLSKAMAGKGAVARVDFKGAPANVTYG